MTALPHPDAHPDAQSNVPPLVIPCAVITVSDSRTPESDRSGQCIQQHLIAAGHTIAHYQILADEPELLRQNLYSLTQELEIAVIILNGGTGIAPRDSTYEVVEPMLGKILPGFGEIFRMLSYQEVGSRAIASRAVAGVLEKTLVFCLPGSTKAVELAMNKLIVPELAHLNRQLRGLL